MQNAEFIEAKDGSIKMNPNVNIQLIDFSKSEVFDLDLNCNKSSVNHGGIQYLAPQIITREVFDASAADIWSLGMVMFECIVGEPLYHQINLLEPVEGTGYYAVMTGGLDVHIKSSPTLSKLMKGKMQSLVVSLLEVEEAKRLNSVQVLEHEWFTLYCQKYKGQIVKKSKYQHKRLKAMERADKMKNFPYYRCFKYM